MGVVDEGRRAVERNFDPKIAFSAMAGVAGLGVVAWLMHRSNVKLLKKAANVATAKAK